MTIYSKVELLRVKAEEDKKAMLLTTLGSAESSTAG